MFMVMMQCFHVRCIFFLFSLTSYSLSYSYVEILNVIWGFFVGHTKKVIPSLLWKFTIYYFAGSEIFTLTMRTVVEKAFILMYISLREHCIAVTQLKVTVCHIFTSQLNIYKEKENLSINISIKSQPEFFSASRSSFARATSVPKVSPSRRRRSGSSSMTTGFASPMTILKQIFKRLIFFLISKHTQKVKMKANIAVMSTT